MHNPLSTREKKNKGEMSLLFYAFFFFGVTSVFLVLHWNSTNPLLASFTLGYPSMASSVGFSMKKAKFLRK